MTGEVDLNGVLAALSWLESMQRGWIWGLQNDECNGRVVGWGETRFRKFVVEVMSQPNHFHMPLRSR